MGFQALFVSKRLFGKLLKSFSLQIGVHKYKMKVRVLLKLPVCTHVQVFGAYTNILNENFGIKQKIIIL
jgi:hypothetical protein